MYPRAGGLILDLSDDTWSSMAAPPGTDQSMYRVVAAAGFDAVALGGADWAADGAVRRDVWIWRAGG